MSDKTETSGPKKRGGMMKILLIALVAVLLVGGGVGGGLYAMNAGLLGGGGGHGESDAPRLVPKEEEVRATLGKEGDHGDGGDAHGGKATPKGEGGDKYASNYYPLEKEFTSNLQESVHFVQVGIAVSTPYDARVLENLKTHEIAVRSQVLLALGDTSEEEVFTVEGKRKLQVRLAKAINAVLKEKEGFGGISNVYFTNFIVQ